MSGVFAVECAPILARGSDGWGRVGNCGGFVGRGSPGVQGGFDVVGPGGAVRPAIMPSTTEPPVPTAHVPGAAEAARRSVRCGAARRAVGAGTALPAVRARNPAGCGKKAAKWVPEGPLRAGGCRPVSHKGRYAACLPARRDSGAGRRGHDADQQDPLRGFLAPTARFSRAARRWPTRRRRGGCPPLRPLRKPTAPSPPCGLGRDRWDGARGPSAHRRARVPGTLRPRAPYSAVPRLGR